MAYHNNLRSMSIEAIDEYLAIAEYCVSTPKTNGGIYGYPSVLLLFCVIDALSIYIGYPANTLREVKTIFPKLTQRQIEQLACWYRHLLAHQAFIMPGTQISDEPTGDPIEFNSDAEPTHIRVVQLCRFVRRWWEAFDKGRISPRFNQRQAPKTPVPTTISSLPGISGCNNVMTAKP
jgi:hypothetical protein